MVHAVEKPATGWVQTRQGWGLTLAKNAGVPPCNIPSLSAPTPGNYRQPGAVRAGEGQQGEG
ncbi:MAG TPA: hypothetical protein VHV83_04805 [Armatimonadota bacterium]|nr:hypothetical protein [Armatimonadota bacterium]